MFRVDLPDYPYPLFFVVDPRNDRRFNFMSEPITWKIFPRHLLAKGMSVPNFQRKIGDTTETYSGFIGRSVEHPTKYLQAAEEKYLIGYDIVESPMILDNWNAWLTVSPKVAMDF